MWRRGEGGPVGAVMTAGGLCCLTVSAQAWAQRRECGPDPVGSICSICRCVRWVRQAVTKAERLFVPWITRDLCAEVRPDVRAKSFRLVLFSRAAILRPTTIHMSANNGYVAFVHDQGLDLSQNAM